ncbi:hypothetical protein Acsp04_03870 [Actinomadura sp. NBRC 104425]|uniref:hypothetical protein n=1 Tax=Actinomadura sp. NBRC 104425 TaxID=3032204 RepID=UPI0024A5F954|nr:hypothetical protein [Actinomadura sp. NBRC 104425]GLZ10152.1 hypothetical protein Acsp04_03870 [Actinomadura sp. NBRC 104425]
MFKKTFAAASLVASAVAGALLLSSPADADGRDKGPRNVVNVYNYNMNSNTNTNNNNLATLNIPDPLALLLG